nr:MAG TPA: receptor binding complex [Caudoviricetes sp.]
MELKKNLRILKYTLFKTCLKVLFKLLKFFQTFLKINFQKINNKKFERVSKMASTGIIQRRNTKSFFENIDNKPIVGEVVFAVDTNEYGALDDDGNILWRKHEGIVRSVANKVGDVELDKFDVKLDQVDNTADIDKILSKKQKEYIDAHINDKSNPHEVSKVQVGLGNVDNTADIDKPISTLMQSALDLKLDKSAIPPNAKFTDTTYEIKDGELSEFNFSSVYKNKLDYLENNKQLLHKDRALRVQGRKITLTRADGSIEEIETQDTLFDPSDLNNNISALQNFINSLSIINDLNGNDPDTSKKSILSAEQGKILNDKINEIKKTLESDNINLDTLKEIVQFIENNRSLIESLTIDNISGLRDALNRKVDWVNNENTVQNSLNFDGHDVSYFLTKTEFEFILNSLKNTLTSLTNKFHLYYTKQETDSLINSKISNIDYSPINNKITELSNKVDENKSTIDTKFNNSTTNINNEITELKKKDHEIQSDLIQKFNSLTNEISNLDIVAIQNSVKQLKEAIESGSFKKYDDLIKEINDKIQSTNLKFNEYLSLANQEDKWKINFDSFGIPKIDEKLQDYVTLTKLEKSLNDLKKYLDIQKIKNLEDDLESLEDEIKNNTSVINYILQNMGKSKVFVVSATEPQDKDVIWIQPTTEVQNVLDETKIKKIIDDKFKEYQKNRTFMRVGNFIKTVNSAIAYVNLGEDNSGSWSGIQNLKLIPQSNQTTGLVTFVEKPDGNNLLNRPEEQKVVSGIVILDNTSGKIKNFSFKNQVLLNSIELSDRVIVFSYFYDGTNTYVSQAN